MRSSPLTKEEIDQANSVVILSILIATTKDRRVMFNSLMQEFNRQVEHEGLKGKCVESWQELKLMQDETGNQIYDEDTNEPVYELVSKGSFKHPDIVEILFEEDEKELSIGAKRQKLLDRANGKYVCWFDSDDWPSEFYIKEIKEAIETEPDCIGFKIAMTTNGSNPETCIHSLRNPEWKHDGINYLRNVTHFNPVKKDLALAVGFPDLRFGEDKVYSDAISQLCKKEVFIDKFMFDYRYSNKIPHGIKYGISK